MTPLLLSSERAQAMSCSKALECFLREIMAPMMCNVCVPSAAELNESMQAGSWKRSSLHE